MSATVVGRLNWELEQDKDGHRTYSIEWLVRVTDFEDDGPATVLGASGLPAVGATWAYGNDSDAWAFCWPTARVRPVLRAEKGKYWIVEQTFTTKPLNRCQTSSIENPLNEPADISGNFVKFVREATRDRNGDLLTSSSHEQYRGAIVERDDNRPGIRASVNLVSLPLATACPLIDTLNDATLWGLPINAIKFSNMPWQRKLYGTCTYYYTVTYEFEVDYNTLFKRYIMDEGTKVLKPGGDANNPKDFARNKDLLGGHGKILLDGSGEALDDAANPYIWEKELYDESNFLLLPGLPTSL